MHRLLTLLVGLATLTIVPAYASAGSLGDFKESYDEADERAESDDDDDDDDDDSAAGEVVGGVLNALLGGGGGGCTSCGSSSSSSNEATNGSPNPFLIVGHLPGRSFALGRAPYEGRGIKVSSTIEDLGTTAVAGNSPETYDSAMRMDGNVDDRHYQFTLRANTLTTTQLDAMGTEVFGKLTSSYMPGMAFSYQYMSELRSEETLALGYWVYEPNIFLLPAATMSWNVGLVTMGDQAMLDEAGATAGVALEAFPKDPLFIDARLNVHGFKNVGMLDGRVGAGAFFTDQLAVEFNVRHLNIFDGGSLTMYGLGVRSYLGF
ncbi:MAG: hypothetical protein ACQEVA_19360 [Myxococcota bacterium]